MNNFQIKQRIFKTIIDLNFENLYSYRVMLLVKVALGN